MDWLGSAGGVAEELQLAQQRAARQEEAAREAVAEASRLRDQLAERTREVQMLLEKQAQLKSQVRDLLIMHRISLCATGQLGRHNPSRCAYCRE